MKWSKVSKVEPSNKEKLEYMKSWKPVQLGGFYGIIRGIRFVKRTKLFWGRLLVNILISISPIVISLLFPLPLYISIPLGILIFVITGFVLKPFRVVEIDTEDYNLK